MKSGCFYHLCGKIFLSTQGILANPGATLLISHHFCGTYFRELILGPRPACGRKENEDEDIVDRRAKRVRKVVGLNEGGKEAKEGEGSKRQPAPLAVKSLHNSRDPQILKSGDR